MNDSAYDAEGSEIRITLYSGRRIDLRKIQPEEILIEDIAHALSNLCRFTGHVREFYSVAQHCVIVSQLVPKELALQALLHDASEAYLNDLSHYVKHSPELDGYRVLEATLEEKIFAAFHLPATLDPKVKLADRTACEMEWLQLLKGTPSALFPAIVTLTPKEAESAFLAAYRRLAAVHGIRSLTRSFIR